MKDFFANLFKCTSETMIERIKSPIVGAFVFSWLFFNWKTILILLFSDSKVEDKIDIISKYITLESLLYPAIFSIVYSLAIPVISVVVEWCLKKVSINSIELAYAKKNIGLIKKKDSEKLRADADIAYERQKTGAEKEIQEMRENITKSKEREGILVKERESAINEKNEILKINEGLKKETDYLNVALSELRKENSKLKSIVEINNNSVEGIESYDVNEFVNKSAATTRVKYKNDILKVIGIEENESMAKVAENIYLQDKIMSIPDIKNIFPSVKSIFRKDISFIQFLNTLNLEQLSSFRSTILFE
ncbi:TPA: hypothetical protein ACRRWY_001547 [Morganella morganii]